MSTTYHVTINGNYAQTSLGHITMGDTVVVTVGSGFDNCTHYKLRIIDNYGLEVWKPGEELYTPQTTFTYTFEDRANTDYINAWGGGLVISLRGYKQITSSSRTYYSWQSSGTASGYLQVDTTKYRPTMSFGDVTINKSYNGLALAGISTISSTLNTSHLNSSDKATLNDPKLILGNDNYLSSNNAVTLSGTTVTSTDTVPTSDESYHIWFKGYIQDSRYVYQDGARGSLPWAISTQDKPTYVESAKVLVYPYALPTYDPNYTYVNRCASSGRPDGAGNYARIHIAYAISTFDGTNKLVSISGKVSGSKIDPINSNYKTVGYADYIISIASSDEATVTFTIIDTICNALNMTSTFTLKIPKTTLPLSLFDDGTNRGTAFGQMATRVGNWFYGNLIFVKDSTPYLIEPDGFGSTKSRILCGDTGSRKVYVSITIQADNSTAAQQFGIVYVYESNNFGKKPLTELAISSGDTKKQDVITVPVGTTLWVWLPNDWDLLDYTFTTWLNGVKVWDKNDKDNSKIASTYAAVQGSIREFQCVPITEYSTLIFYIASTKPSLSDTRKRIKVVSSGASNYSFHDEDNLFHSDNAELDIPVLVGSYNIKLYQECYEKQFLYWMYNNTKYYEDAAKTTGIPISILSSDVTVTGYYTDFASVITLTIIGGGIGWGVVKTGGSTIYDKEPPIDTTTLNLAKNTVLSDIFFYNPDGAYIIINGTAYGSLFQIETTVTDYTLTTDTTIYFKS